MKSTRLFALVGTVAAVVAVLAINHRRPSADHKASPALPASAEESPSSSRLVRTTTRATATSNAPQSGEPNPYEMVKEPASGLPLFRYALDLLNCNRKKQCPKDAICALDADKRVGCFTSNCRGRFDTTSCGPHDVCWQYDSVFRCVPDGNADEGQECFDVAASKPEKRCHGGLACWAGRCRSACSSSGGCAAGLTCATLGNGDSACVDPKEFCNADSDCSPQHVCMAAKGQQLKTCYALATYADGSRSCVAGSCASGEACGGPIFGGTFYGKCHSICGSNGACSDGFVCGSKPFAFTEAPQMCFRQCDINHRQACTPDESCGSVDTQNNMYGCSIRTPIDPNQRDHWAGVFTQPSSAPASN